MGDVATQNLFALLGDEGEDPLADFSQPKQEVKEKKKPSAAPAEGRPGSHPRSTAQRKIFGLLVC